jgi:histidine triad (HIT) family protein
VSHIRHKEIQGMTECLFCRVVAEQIPATVVYRDDRVVAFRDINPRAPLHVLLVPTKHIPSLLDLSEEDDALIGYLVRKAAQIARDEGVAERGFRLVTNTGPEAGQSVGHVHVHLLGGRPLSWPPG